jgi:Glycosyl transferase family 2
VSEQTIVASDVSGPPVPQVRSAPPVTAVVATTVEIVIPVFNEERALSGCVATLHAHLATLPPFHWTITVVDNGSTDDTRGVACALVARWPGVRTTFLERRGKGHALRTAWLRSTADIVAYMDVDLSTGLDALLPLIAPLVHGHSDLAIGSRLSPWSRTVRGARRELVSRTYNALLRLIHGTEVRDAQCGFKAARTSAIRALLPHVEDEAWFFDTELLLLAEHNGLRVHEVPVDWTENTDSRVAVGRAAWGNLCGLLRVAAARMSGLATVAGSPTRPDGPAHRPTTSARYVTFSVLAGLAVLANLLLYALFRVWSPPLAANVTAGCLTARFTAEADRTASAPATRRYLPGVLVFTCYTALTSGALLLLAHTAHHPSRLQEFGVLLAASMLGTAVRFLVLRRH